jgi:hypothetical protein
MTEPKGAFRLPSKLDWTTEFGEREWEGLAGYYMSGSGQPTLDGQRFIPLMYRLRPDALKRYRLAIDAGRLRRGDLPDAARALSSLFDHVLRGYAKGILYDLRGSRQRGARRADVAHVLTLAWLQTGNEGVHVAADVAGDELEAWDPTHDGPGLTWPDGWRADAGAWRCGIDWLRTSDADEISAEDLAKLRKWHRDVEGSVPDFVQFLATYNPLALKTYRARYENAMDGSLPVQFVALLLVSSAVQPDAMRRAMHMARTFGVARAHVISMLTRPRATARGLGTQDNVDLNEIADLLESWE